MLEEYTNKYMYRQNSNRVRRKFNELNKNLIKNFKSEGFLQTSKLSWNNNAKQNHVKNVIYITTTFSQLHSPQPSRPHTVNRAVYPDIEAETKRYKKSNEESCTNEALRNSLVHMEANQYRLTNKVDKAETEMYWPIVD